MPPLTSARRRALRAMLSAVAGGGLTAASLGGPLASGAAGATATTGATPNEGSSASAPAESGAGAQEAEAGQSSTTTTTTTPVPTPPPSETPAVPTSTVPTSTVPTSSAPSTPAPAPSTPEAPTVVLQRKQKPSTSAPANPNGTSTQATTKSKSNNPKKATGPNNVAASPQSVAAQAGALAAMLATSEASAQALAFYRIPLFLLPIYKAAAVQYGVPWQILAAINEIETNYGTDQAVSSAGAVGWMQFMPSTWLQYGVDALNAGYADPYNPVDAIFAAARYLRAAGAEKDLRGAILAYNHSEEYADSVLLRAKLITTYPKAVIATLTGLVDGRLPVTGKHVAWHSLPSALLPASSATAAATAVATPASSASGAASGTVSGAASTGAGAPGSSAPLSPTAAAAAAAGKAAASAKQVLELVELITPATASVVAVQDGRIVHLGNSRKLGKYLVLRDVYGDLFTYVGLGSIAPSYTPPKIRSTPAKSPVVEAASTHDPAPSQAASAGTQSPVTLHVKTPPKKSSPGHGQISLQLASEDEAPAGMNRVRLFAHPGNPDARAAAVASAARKARRTNVGHRLPLRKGSVVASGTVLGRVSVPPGARDGHLRFAIRPAGDASTVNPGPILANWAQLQTALHPKGAKATNALLGATASDVFLLSRAQLERAVLSDPGITLETCVRHEVASGLVDRRILAVLTYLSRSGLKPTASALSCAQSHGTTSGSSQTELDISAINDTPITAHQGPGTITDLTIRALLTLPGEFVPHQIFSLMRYPGSSNTHAASTYSNRIHLVFGPAPATAKLDPAAAATTAHSANGGPTAPAPLLTTSSLNNSQWSKLMERVAALPTPVVATKPSSAAIPDAKAPAGPIPTHR